MENGREASIKSNIPSELFALAELMRAEGFSLYAVGGLVRNSLLSIPISDVDICSAMEPESFIALCEKNGCGVVPKGLRFGTVEVHIGKKSFEHTTFRSDSYDEGGTHRPVAVRFSQSLEEDAFRRDFSVNALYYDILCERVLDPTGGLSDLETGVIRTTSADPRTVLGDDGLRLMRMVRFAAELGFMIEENTFAAARELIKNLRDISPERIRDELDKLLLADVKYGERSSARVFHGLELLRDVGALGVVLPELALGAGMEQRREFHRYDVLDHSLHTASETPPELALRLAGLLHDVGKPPVKLETGLMHGHDVRGEAISAEILRRLKYDNKTIERVRFLVRHHMYDLDALAKESTLRKRFARWGVEKSLALCELRIADVHGSGIISGEVVSAERWRAVLQKMLGEGVPFSEKELALSGADLMRELNVPPGPEIARLKAVLFEHCAVRPRDNTRERLLKLARDALPRKRR